MSKANEYRRQAEEAAARIECAAASTGFPHGLGIVSGRCGATFNLEAGLAIATGPQ